MHLNPIRFDRFKSLVPIQDWDDLLLHAKLDSGATVCSLHAERIEEFKRGKEKWVRFFVLGDHDRQESAYHCNAKLVGSRYIRSSNGHISLRPVIETMLRIADFQWPIEVTLSNRETLE